MSDHRFLDRILARIHGWVQRREEKSLKPEAVGRTCYGCRGPLGVGAVYFMERWFCSEHCIPTLYRRFVPGDLYFKARVLPTNPEGEQS